MENSVSSIIEEVIQVLKKFVVDANKNAIRGDGEWTYELKERLGNLGAEKGYEIAASGFAGNFESEWLYDMTWYKENEQKQLTEIGLVVESEWAKSFKAIKYDFEKLLQAKASLKLMICQHPDTEIDTLFEKFKSSIKSFKASSAEEHYLFAILDSNTDKAFHFRKYPC